MELGASGNLFSRTVLVNYCMHVRSWGYDRRNMSSCRSIITRKLSTNKTWRMHMITPVMRSITRHCDTRLWWIVTIIIPYYPGNCSEATWGQATVSSTWRQALESHPARHNNQMLLLYIYFPVEYYVSPMLGFLTSKSKHHTREWTISVPEEIGWTWKFFDTTSINHLSEQKDTIEKSTALLIEKEHGSMAQDIWPTKLNTITKITNKIENTLLRWLHRQRGVLPERS